MVDNRDDDAFMRRIIWLLIASLISTVGGWIWTVAVLQSEVSRADERINKLENIQIELTKTMVSVDKGVAILVANSQVRNDLLRNWREKQEVIYGEQKRRLPLITWVEKQMQREYRP